MEVPQHRHRRPTWLHQVRPLRSRLAGEDLHELGCSRQSSLGGREPRGAQMKVELTLFNKWSKPRIERYADGWNHAYFGVGYFAWKPKWKAPPPSKGHPRTTDSYD